MSDAPELMNIKQLATRLKVPLRTMHYWLKRGTCPIPHIEGMKPPKWWASDVEAYVSRQDAAE